VPGAALVATLALTALLYSAAGAADGVLSVYREALRSDSTYLAVAAATRATREARPQARAALLPLIGASASTSGTDLDLRRSNVGFTTRRNNFHSTQIQLTLTQPLYRRDLWIALSQATDQIKQAEAQFAFAGQELIVRVAVRYFAVLQAIDDLRFARSVLKAFGEQLKQSRQRFDVGLIAVTDVEESQAGFDLANSQVISAQNQIDNAREALREVTGTYHSSLAPLRAKMTLTTPDPDSIDSWAKRALENNFSVRAARYAAAIAKKEISRIESGHLPTLDLVGSHARDSSNGLSGSHTWTTTLGLQLNVPIFQGGLVLSRTRQSRHLYQQAVEELERARRNVERQTRDDFLNIKSAIAQIKALRQAVRSNESATRAVKAGFEVGTRTSVDVLDAQRDLFKARSDLSAARYQYILDVLRLKQAAGTLAEEDIQKVDALLKP